MYNMLYSTGDLLPQLPSVPRFAVRLSRPRNDLFRISLHKRNHEGTLLNLPPESGGATKRPTGNYPGTGTARLRRLFPLYPKLQRNSQSTHFKPNGTTNSLHQRSWPGTEELRAQTHLPGSTAHIQNTGLVSGP